MRKQPLTTEELTALRVVRKAIMSRGTINDESWEQAREMCAKLTEVEAWLIGLGEER